MRKKRHMVGHTPTQQHISSSYVGHAVTVILKGGGKKNGSEQENVLCKWLKKKAFHILKNNSSIFVSKVP